MQPITRNARKNRTTLITFLVLLLLLLVVNFRMIAPYILSLLMGGILALISQPLYRLLRAKKVGPKISAALVTLAILLLVIGPMAAFTAIAVDQGIAFGQQVSQHEGFTMQSIVSQATEWAPVQTMVGDAKAVESQIKSGIQNGGRLATATILSFVKNVPDIVLQIALALFTCFFFLIDGKRFMFWLRDKIPLDYDVRDKLYASFKDTAISVIWATIAAAAVQAAVMMVAFLVLRVPLAFLAGGATFIFAWIPVLGSTPVWIGGAIYLYVQGEIGKMVVMLVFGMIAGVSDNFVRPLVLKGRGDMHPLVSLVAIFGGLSMFGILGVFFGPILTAILISLLQIWPAVGKRFGLIEDKALPLLDPAPTAL